MTKLIFLFFLSFIYSNSVFLLCPVADVSPYIEMQAINHKARNILNDTDLDYVGNQIWNRLDSDFERKVFEKYWKGNGDLELTRLRFEKIKEYLRIVVDFRKAPGYDINLNDGTKGKAFIVSFYGSKEYGHAFGAATVYTKDNYEIVGFWDYYDFDFRPFGERSFKAEAISRIIHAVSPKKAMPFNITFGLQYSQPIYDKFIRITDVKHC